MPVRDPVGRVAAEVSTPCTAAFDGDDWLFSVDWEGSRCLLVTDGAGSTRLQGETADLSTRFPEIVRAADRGLGRAAVLDGVVCVLDAEGRPDLPGLSRRVVAAAERPAAVMLVTDLLHLDGASLLDRPLEGRLAALAEVGESEHRLQAPEHVAGNGRALAEAAAERGLTAVLARRRDARYHAGLASPDRLRIALSERRNAVVVGTRDAGTARQLLLADWVRGRLGLVGVASLERGPARTWLTRTAVPSPHPVAVDDPAAAGPRVSWLQPRLVATVEPMAGGRARGLPAWKLVALRDDVDPMWCVRRPPVDPPQATSHQPLRPFSPTVLTALPIGG